MAEIDPEAWDALAPPGAAPFMEWEWLHRMEASGSIAPHTGWVPVHLTLWRNRRLAAAAPLYVKTHSHGEFVFDHLWQDVSLRLGLPYFPKLVGMSPVTPLAGYRFLVAPGENEAAVTQRMMGEIGRFAEEKGLSGCHFLHVNPDWARRTAAPFDFQPWWHQSFVWRNQEFHSFQDYLDLFRTNQRRNIRRERGTLKKLGIEVRHLTGEAIPPSSFRLMYRYYENTNEKFGPWGCKYLTPSFFDELEGYRHRLLLITAEMPGRSRPVGMSLLLHKGGRLYGRYWGSAEEVNHLHFNLCYYEPIRWAIANGIRTYDPGMGGSHKVRRGFVSVPNISLHRFTDPRMQEILRRNIGTINRMEQAHIDELNEALPFARRPPTTSSRSPRR
jgi:predicted N-acyltransferase